MAIFQSIKDKFSKSDDKDKYLQGLDKSRRSFGDRIRALSNNFHGIDDDLLEELMVILLEGDVGIQTAQKIVDSFEEHSNELKNFDSMEDYFIYILYEFYDDVPEEYIHFNPDGPTVILMVGVNGSGKTTTSAKLLQLYQSLGKKVAVAAADTFRAGAIDQIDTWAQRIGVPCIKGKPGQDPSSVLVDACRYAKENDIDILIGDTAGRLQNKKNLMKELEKINKVIGKFIPNAPHETLLVIDATTGQNGILQAKAFKEITNITGIVLTKLDGTAKGGIVLAIKEEVNLPVKFIGLGESMEDLQTFDIENYIYGLFKDMV